MAIRHTTILVALLTVLTGCGGDSDGDERPITGSAARIVFALLEPPQVNIYASDLDGGHRVRLASRTFPDSIAGASLVGELHAAVSPDGRHLAYQFPFSSNDIFVVDTLLELPPSLLARVDDFAYAPNGRRLLLGNHNGYSGEEAPLYGPASTWTLHALDAGDRALDVGESGANELGGWIDDARVLLVARSNYGGFGNRLFVLDVDSGSLTEVSVHDGIQLGDFAAGPRGLGTVTLLPPAFGAEYSCDIYPIRDARLGIPYVTVPDSYCRGLAWNGADELWHGRGTGPHGRIDVSDVNAFGYYVLGAIYRYRVSLDRDEPVVESDGVSSYDFGGVLPGVAIAIVEHRPDREAVHRLEIRDLNGHWPRVVGESRFDVMFIGWSGVNIATAP